FLRQGRRHRPRRQRQAGTSRPAGNPMSNAMSHPTSNAAAPVKSEPVRPVASPAEAEALVKHLLDVMDALSGTVEEETELVRAGRLVEATKLEPAKAELSLMYIADTTRIKA